MMRTIFVFGILGIGIVSSFFNRYAALLLYLWFALFRPQEFLWISISEWRLSLIIGLLLVVPCLLTGILPNMSRPLSIGSILFIIVACVAQAGAYNAATSWMWLDYIVKLIVISLFAVTLIDNQRKFIVAVAVIAGSFGFYSAKAGLAYLIGGGVRFSDGLAGAFIDNNGYALGIAMVLPLLFAVSQNIRRKHPIGRWVRYGFLAALLFSPLAIIGTFSRGGLIALGTAIAVFSFLQQKRLRIIICMLSFIAIVIIFVPIPKEYYSRMETIGTYNEINDESALGRIHFWKVAIDMARDHPLGIGLRGYENAYDKYDYSHGRYGTKRAVHSSHFEVLAGTGIIGALIWIGLFLYALVAAFRIRAHSHSNDLDPENKKFFYTFANGLIASIVCFVVGGSFLSGSLNDITWLSFALISSLEVLYSKVRNETMPVGEERKRYSDAIGVGTNELGSFVQS
jgi:putative inorganic carbon (hco3(-)) transporter